jgi:hypothetical protein
MADAFATPEDLEKRWRPLLGPERDRAETLLGDASVMLRAEYPDLTARTTAVPPALPELDPAVPLMVVCKMVKRSMLAAVDQPPVSAQQQSAGPFAQSLTFSNPTGDLYLSKAERRMLGYGGQEAFTIDISRRSSYGDRPWLRVTEPRL